MKLAMNRKKKSLRGGKKLGCQAYCGLRPNSDGRRKGSNGKQRGSF